MCLSGFTRANILPLVRSKCFCDTVYLAVGERGLVVFEPNSGLHWMFWLFEPGLKCSVGLPDHTKRVAGSQRASSGLT